MAPIHRKKTAAALALLCLTVLFLGDGARAVHLLTARHVLCAAHGDLVEAQPVGAPVETPETDGASVLPGEPVVDHHEHCSVAAAPTRPFACPIAEPDVLVTASVADHVVGLTELRSAHGRSVLAYAPKQGPPLG